MPGVLTIKTMCSESETCFFMKAKRNIAGFIKESYKSVAKIFHTGFTGFWKQKASFFKKNGLTLNSSP